MATGWLTNGKGQKRYFKSNGVMVAGKYKVDGSTYYFNKSTGITTWRMGDDRWKQILF